MDEIPQDLWQIATARELVIRPLAAQHRIRADEIENAAVALGVRRAYVYRLLSAYRNRPQTSTLVPKQRGRRKRMRVLDANVENVIQVAIDEIYLSRERPRVSDLMREIRSRCHAKQLEAPDSRTVVRRISALDARTVTAARHGAKRACEQFNPALTQPRPVYPLDFVEIDHSPVDVIVVDEESRMPLGRPWLTLAVDIPTRMVLGFYLSFDAPPLFPLLWYSPSRSSRKNVGWPIGTCPSAGPRAVSPTGSKQIMARSSTQMLSSAALPSMEFD